MVRETGPRHVLVTSVIHGDTSTGSVDVVAVSDGGLGGDHAPLPINPNGGGDVTAALYLAHLWTTGSPATALERTIASVFAVLEATLAAGARELQLIAAQNGIAQPPAGLTSRRLR